MPRGGEMSIDEITEFAQGKNRQDIFSAEPFVAVSEAKKRSFVKKMLAAPKAQLDRDVLKSVPRSSGVYGIYPNPDAFTEKTPQYLHVIAEIKMPIYIGKADADLQSRLLDHIKTIEEVDKLEPEWLAFSCVPTNSSIDALAMEQAAIDKFKTPAWNGAGFGGKSLGTGRSSVYVSEFDSYHEGRGRGEETDARQDPEEVEKKWIKKARSMSGCDRRTMIYKILHPTE